MIYFTEDTLYIPRTSSYVGSNIRFTNLTTKKYYDFSIDSSNDLYYKFDKTSTNLPDGQYSYNIDNQEYGLAQVGNFTNNNKSYTTKIQYKQYSL